MTRSFKLLGASHMGGKVRIAVVSRHLKSEPVDFVELTPGEALELAEDMIRMARFALKTAPSHDGPAFPVVSDEVFEQMRARAFGASS